MRGVLPFSLGANLLVTDESHIIYVKFCWKVFAMNVCTPQVNVQEMYLFNLSMSHIPGLYQENGFMTFEDTNNEYKEISFSEQFRIPNAKENS